ncbi:MAG: cob(I)yrinic acid a,c-diamide adenosyltransferase [Candidatus Omnitrophica bacterium]|nr:cob(I)yrinic acid a,c-diamide adenosyltransferase [Candidatus Omnitrophota bacterium]
MRLKRGYIHVYTGKGKGKTTAALGLALRASGAGLKVYIGQFIKKGCYSEVKALKKHRKNIRIEQFGRGCFISKKARNKDLLLAEKGLSRVAQIFNSKKYDLVILDELNVATHLNLVSVGDVVKIIKKRPRNVEVVITGRHAPKKILGLADLITEMKEIRHPYARGTRARCGIES